MSFVHPLVVGFLVALGVGLLIGIDRERKKGDGPTRQAAGLRTFTLASLAGATAMAVGEEVVLAAVALGMVAFAGLSYWRTGEDDPGLTSEAALVVTTLLGGLAIKHPEFAAGLGVVVAVLLAARSALHRFVRSVLTDDELRDLLIFAAATLIVLPLLPDKPIGPYGALNLRTVWTIVVLVMAVSALGYVAVRVVGPRYGLPL
ncbi:MAG TPA: MgtC/SapB family protein, partial [Reyranella sp.]|nr:MgtC/SapB family protein [Reyranella sp.]